MAFPTDEETGVMMKGVDRQQTVDFLQSLLRGMGLRYDFLYLPWDSKRNSNIGLVFVNFLDGASAQRCIQEFTMLKSEHGVTRLFKTICKSYVHGFAQNIAFFLISVGVEGIDDDHAPLVFDNLGRRISLRWAATEFVTMDLLMETQKIWLQTRGQRQPGKLIASRGLVAGSSVSDSEVKGALVEKCRKSNNSGKPMSFPEGLPGPIELGYCCQAPRGHQESGPMPQQTVPSRCPADLGVAAPGPSYFPLSVQQARCRQASQGLTKSGLLYRSLDAEHDNSSMSTACESVEQCSQHSGYDAMQSISMGNDMLMATRELWDCNRPEPTERTRLDKMYSADKDMLVDGQHMEPRRLRRLGIPAQEVPRFGGLEYCCEAPQGLQESKQMPRQAVPSRCLADLGVATPGPCFALSMQHSQDLMALRPPFSTSSHSQHFPIVPCGPAGVKRANHVGNQVPRSDGPQIQNFNSKVQISTVRVGGQDVTIIDM